MVSYDNLPDDPFARSTEIDRRIESEITKIIARRRTLRKALLIVALLAPFVIGWVIFQLVNDRTLTSDDYIAEAAIKRSQGRLAASVQALDAALAIDPSRLGARRLRAELALALGDSRAARENLQLASPDGRGPVVILGLLRASLLDHDFERVVRDAAVEIARTPSDELDLVLIQGQIGTRDFEPARAALRTLLSRMQNHREALQIRAYLLLAEGDIDGAANDLDRLSAIGESLATTLLTGEVALARSAHREAERSFAAALDKRPDHPEARFSQARAALAAGNRPLAQQALARLRLGAEHPLVSYLNAWTQWQDKDSSGALAALKRALQSWPGHADALFLSAEIHFASSQYGQALALLKPLAAPHDPGAIGLLARTYIALSRPEDAVELLEPQTEQARASPYLRGLLKQAYAARGDAEKANALGRLPHGGGPPSRRPLHRCNVLVFACEQCLFVRQCR